MKDYNLDYDVKCINCGEIKNRRMSKDDKKTDFENWQYLFRMFCAHLSSPSAEYCNTCNRYTAHQYLSCVGKPENEN